MVKLIQWRLCLNGYLHKSCSSDVIVDLSMNRRHGFLCCRTTSMEQAAYRAEAAAVDLKTFLFLATTCQTWSTCILFRQSLHLELTSWAYPAININSCLQALTKDISTLADIAPSALETIIFYCFMGYISALTYFLLLVFLWTPGNTLVIVLWCALSH